MDFDAQLRRHVYDAVSARGIPPTIAELAAAASLPAAEVRDGLARLAEKRILVLQRESGEILMAPPFAALPTPFLVETARHQSYANCGWDALGVPVMLREPARVKTGCGCCGEAITLDVTHDAPPAGGAVMHFAVPAARWWQDLVFT